MHASSRSRQATPLLALLLAAIGCALLYGAALARFPLLQIYARPLQNLDRLTLSVPAVGWALVGCIVLLFLGYGLGASVAGAASRRRTARWLIVGMPLLFVALLFLVYPTTSLDIYDYLFRGRMLVRYQVNTFVAVPADFPNDPLMNAQPFRFIPWSRAVTAYGPLWEGMSWLAARLAGEAPGQAPATIDPSLLRLMLAYKALGAAGFLACGAMIWAALGRMAPERRWLGLYLWLWNPLALWESVVAGHNDAWMAALIVLAIWLFGDQEVAGVRTTQPVKAAAQAFLALTLGGLIKYLALCFGPLMLAAGLRRLPGRGERARLVAVGAALCVGVVALAYAPFWVGPDTLRNFGDRGTLFYASWLATLQSTLAEFGMAKEIAQRVGASLGIGLLAAGVLWSAWRGWVAPERVAEHALWLLLWFLFVCNTWFQPWYLLWAVALAALQPARARMLQGIVVFCCTAMLSYVAGSFLLPALGWSGESAAWNGLLSAMIYGPPLLAMGWSGRARLRRAAQRLERNGRERNALPPHTSSEF